MKRITKSLAVLALTATFAGSAAAEYTFQMCLDAIGFQTYVDNYDINKNTTNGGAEAWAAIAGGTYAVGSGKRDGYVNCSIPKNNLKGGKGAGGTFEIGTMTNDQCGLHNSMLSVDSKIQVNKWWDAQSALDAVQKKLVSLRDQGKLTYGYDTISTEVGDIQMCVNGMIAQGGN